MSTIEQATFDAVAQYGSHKAAAEALGVSVRTIEQRLYRARRRAAARGHAPEHGLDKPAPEGTAWAGATTLYRVPEGDPHGRVLQWVKTRPERTSAAELAEIAAEALADAVRPVEPLPAPERFLATDELLAVYLFGDPHFGMYADRRETGVASYDTKIASALHRGALDLLAARTPAAARAALVLIGDTMHADGRQWTTSRSGHVLDGDGRAWSVYAELVHALAWMCDRLLVRHGAVDLVIVPGNHDDFAAHTLAIAMRQRYRDEPRLAVADFAGGRFHFLEHGAALIGCYHGDGTRAKIKDFGELAHMHPRWSRARLRHGYTGHVHSERVVEGRGWTAESLPTLAPPDAWAAEAGYLARRSAKADVYHAAGRRVSTHYATPEEIET